MKAGRLKRFTWCQKEGETEPTCFSGDSVPNIPWTGVTVYLFADQVSPVTKSLRSACTQAHYSQRKGLKENFRYLVDYTRAVDLVEISTSADSAITAEVIRRGGMSKNFHASSGYDLATRTG